MEFPVIILGVGMDIFWSQSFYAVFFGVSGASALWALAGVTPHQQQRIASMIGINILVDMLMLKSETLQFIAGMAIIALTTENIENQDKIVAGGGVQPLVRLLRSAKTSEKVCKSNGLQLARKVSEMSCRLSFVHSPLFPVGKAGRGCCTLLGEGAFLGTVRSFHAIQLPAVYSLYGTCGYHSVSFLHLVCS